MKFSKRDKKAIMALIAAKVIGLIALGSGYLKFPILGVPLFLVAGLLIIYCVYNCTTRMEFERNIDYKLIR